MSKAPDAAQVSAYAAAAASVAPPPATPIQIKSETRTFNHLLDFALENQFLWWRERYPKAGAANAWNPLTFDGYFESPRKIPLFIHSDGANLIAISDAHEVHYRKVLKESKRLQLTDVYTCESAIDCFCWEPRWFTRTELHGFLADLEALIRGARLNVKDSFDVTSPHHGAAISHLGPFNGYIEDKAQQKHFDDVGTTTMYVLQDSRRDIRLYDPWAPVYAKLMFPTPESPKNVFLAHNFQASASIMMIIGYDHDLVNGITARPGGEVETSISHLKVCTRIADINTEKMNPHFKCHYFEDPSAPDNFVIPFQPEWLEHPWVTSTDGGATVVPLADFAVTREICIIQTDEAYPRPRPDGVEWGGNSARLLRVVGRHGGALGYFEKYILQGWWTFVADEHVPFREADATPLLGSERYVTTPPPEGTYQGFLTLKAHTDHLVIFKCDHTIATYPATLVNFGPRVNRSKLLVGRLGDAEPPRPGQYPHRELTLYRWDKWTLWIPPVISRWLKDDQTHTYDLVVDDPQFEDDLTQLFQIPTVTACDGALTRRAEMMDDKIGVCNCDGKIVIRGEAGWQFQF